MGSQPAAAPGPWRCNGAVRRPGDVTERLQRVGRYPSGVTNERSNFDPDALPAPVTGVARGGQGTGTALDDTQLYDVSDFTAASIAPAMPHPAPEPAFEHAAVEQIAAEQPSVEQPPPVVVPVSRAAPRATTARRASSDRKPRVGAPVAGLVGFAIAAGLAILVGASLGGMTIPGGAANGEATPRATGSTAPAATQANEGSGGTDGGGTDGGGGDGKWKGNGNGGNGKGNGNGNDD